jgi:hypothetical protein
MGIVPEPPSLFLSDTWESGIWWGVRGSSVLKKLEQLRVKGAWDEEKRVHLPWEQRPAEFKYSIDPGTGLMNLSLRGSTIKGKHTGLSKAEQALGGARLLWLVAC